MTDPHSPDWRPKYTGDGIHPPVNDSEFFGADLYQLYRAGRVFLPELADVYERLTNRVHALKEPVDNLHLNRYERGPARLRERQSDVHRFLRSSCVIMFETGRALVETADAYVATDEEAVKEFAGKLDDDRDEVRKPPHVPDPPRWNDPPPDGSS